MLLETGCLVLFSVTITSETFHDDIMCKQLTAAVGQFLSDWRCGRSLERVGREECNRMLFIYTKNVVFNVLKRAIRQATFNGDNVVARSELFRWNYQT